MFQHFVCGEFLHFAFTALFDNYPAGCMKMKLKAWNIFSSVEVDVDMLATCSKDTDIKEVNYHFVLSCSSFCLLCILVIFMFFVPFLPFSERETY